MTAWRILALWLLWAALLAAGFWGLVQLRDQQREAQTAEQAAQWMPLSAKVISVTVRPIKHARPLGPRFSRWVNYGYAVDGVEYTNTRYSFSGDQTFRTRAQAEAAQPGVGQPIQIYFNPAQPAQSVVDPRPPASPQAWRFRYGLPLLAVADGILLLLAARALRRLIRRNRSARPLRGQVGQ